MFEKETLAICDLTIRQISVKIAFTCLVFQLETRNKTREDNTVSPRRCRLFLGSTASLPPSVPLLLLPLRVRVAGRALPAAGQAP